MCGITAIINKSNSTINLPELIKEMNDKLMHRGPDDEGYVLFSETDYITAGGESTTLDVWKSNTPYTPTHKIENLENNYSIAFGHRRLSVIDLSAAAHQPMKFNNNWIILNGEIYNYIELREELKKLKHNFETNSDTEVLLKAYEQWGFECLNKLNGMWSFIIYDTEKKLLFGSRDRFGVKPLYYYSDNQCIAFASEIKSLLNIPNNNININEKAVFDFLFKNEIEKENQGFFENVFELEPSTYFTYNLEFKNFEIFDYYKLEFNEVQKEFSKKTEKEYIKKTKELISKAVEIRLRSDIPIGFCLSGGIDSSSIVCTANEILKDKTNEKLKVFTAINSSEKFNESFWAEKIVEQTSAVWKKAECNSKDLLSELENIIYYQDIPLSTTSTYAQYKVMQSASHNGIKILIDGQGGDELFAGYAPFYFAYYNELLRNFRFKTFFEELSNIKNSPFSINIYLKAWIKTLADNILPNFYKIKLAKQIKSETKYFKKNFLDNLHEYSFGGDYKNVKTNELLNLFFTKSFLKNLLRWEDRCSMAFSVESRTPFADDIQLIEYIFSLPSNYKIKKGKSKHLLRESMKSTIPESIKNRTDKMGFSTPQQSWLKEINKDLKKIVENHGIDCNYIHNNKLLHDWDKIFESNQTKKQDFIWRYANYLIWKKIFFEK